MATKIGIGSEVYNLDHGPVIARGASYTANELRSALEDRLPALVWDESGRRDAKAALAKAATTKFEMARIQEILGQQAHVEDWRVGEALAEAFLVDHRKCEFPWPHGRDVRNPSASPAGADLVGFHYDAPGGVRFSFGEVKTSEQGESPPSVVKGRSGLVSQIEILRDSSDMKDHLVRYLAVRVHNNSWKAAFYASASRYLRDRSDVSLFGVLVRDIAPPNHRDLGSRPASLSMGCPANTSIELRVKYLPAKSIATLASRVGKPKKVVR